ncbi:MAG: hypothetical protein DRP74_00560 [Candidatus Omnitrophota bacterium]|mgnify:CR=1 FL=1|nr:MAG: hypothetical protein DRP74_00560 [Candidatus Omnitrophota bacterium]
MVKISKVHGKGGYLIIEGIGVVDQLHGWSLSFSRDIVDTPQQGEEYKDSVRGQGSWSGSFSAYYDRANVGKFYDVVNSTTEKDVYLYPEKSDLTKYFYGDAWCDFDLDVPVDGAIDISGTLTGVGQLHESGF